MCLTKQSFLTSSTACRTRPRCCFLHNLCTTSLSTYTPVRPSTRPSLMSASHRALPCADPSNVSFGPLAETHSPTESFSAAIHVGANNNNTKSSQGAQHAGLERPPWQRLQGVDSVLGAGCQKVSRVFLVQDRIMGILTMRRRPGESVTWSRGDTPGVWARYAHPNCWRDDWYPLSYLAALE